MPLLSPQDQQALKTRFKKELRKDIAVRLYTMRSAGLLVIPGRECPTCPQARELLEEVCALSPKLTLETHDIYTESEEAREHGVTRIPCITFSVAGQLQDNVKFYGIPAGYEFSAFLEGLIGLSRGVSPLRVPTRKALRRLEQDVHIQVFVTPG